MQSAHRFTYTIVGDRGVGKTCLELQFTARKFSEAHDLTLGVEFASRTITVDDKRIRLDIWDTAGGEAFVPITKQFYSSAACIILVYDITRRETFDHIATLLERARELSRAGVTLVLIGNKCDLPHMRAVSYHEGRMFAKAHNLVFMEASAKTARNVDEAFILTAERIYKKVQDGVLDLSEKLPSESGGIAGSSYEMSKRCLVWCHKLACQYAGKAKKLAANWLAANLLCQPRETWEFLAGFGVVKCWHANMLASQFLAQNGAMEVDEAEKSR